MGVAGMVGVAGMEGVNGMLGVAGMLKWSCDGTPLGESSVAMATTPFVDRSACSMVECLEVSCGVTEGVWGGG